MILDFRSWIGRAQIEFSYRISIYGHSYLRFFLESHSFFAIQNPKSKIQNPKSKIQNPNSQFWESKFGESKIPHIEPK